MAPRDVKEIPIGDVAIVADDAQRLSFLDSLCVLVRKLAERQDIRLVLATRPSGLGEINSALSMRFESSQIRRLAQLERISDRDVIRLAQEALDAVTLVTLQLWPLYRAIRR